MLHSVRHPGRCWTGVLRKDTFSLSLTIRKTMNALKLILVFALCASYVVSIRFISYFIWVFYQKLILSSIKSFSAFTDVFIEFSFSLFFILFCFVLCGMNYFYLLANVRLVLHSCGQALFVMIYCSFSALIDLICCILGYFGLRYIVEFGISTQEWSPWKESWEIAVIFFFFSLDRTLGLVWVHFSVKDLNYWFIPLIDIWLFRLSFFSWIRFYIFKELLLHLSTTFLITQLFVIPYLPVLFCFVKQDVTV